MSVSKFESVFLRTVFILSTIQGLAWTVLSLTCVILYYNPHEIPNTYKYSEGLPYIFYLRYLKGFKAATNRDLFVVRPADFVAFMWFYFFASATWVLLSVYLHHALKHYKQNLPLYMSGWSILVYILSLIDFILMSLLARDYNACTDNAGNDYCFLVNGIGFTLAARGFLLWLLNVAVASIVLFYGIKLYRDFYITKTVRIPRVHIPNENTDWTKGPNINHSESPIENNGWSNSNHPNHQGQSAVSNPMNQRREHMPNASNDWSGRHAPSRHLNSERFDGQRLGY